MVIVAIIVVIFGYSFMKGHNIFDSSRDFYAVYDNVNGLSSSATVNINGKKVGSVSEIHFLDKKGKILVYMRISNDFKFSKNSVAAIYSDGLIGGKSVKIIPDYRGELAKSGDTLKSKIEINTIENVKNHLEPIQKKLMIALGGIDSLVSGINEILDTTGRRNIKGTLVQVNSTMSHLNNSAAQIDKLMSENSVKLDTTIDNLSKTAYNFSNFSDSLAQIKVKPLLVKVNHMLDDFKEITTKLNDGEGTAGKLLNDNEVYDNLEITTKQLQELIQDIKLNPKRYIHVKFSIFGGKDKSKPYEKPDDPLK